MTGKRPLHDAQTPDIPYHQSEWSEHMAEAEYKALQGRLRNTVGYSVTSLASAARALVDAAFDWLARITGRADA